MTNIEITQRITDIRNELSFIRSDRARGGPERKELYDRLQHELSEKTGRPLTDLASNINANVRR